MDGNGVDGLMAPSSPLLPSEYAVFTVGGQQYQIKVLTLWDLEFARVEWEAIQPGAWLGYASEVLTFLVKVEEGRGNQLDRMAMAKACSAGEALKFADSLNDLLVKSGLLSEGEVKAASLGTGTLTDSPPNSQQEGSVAEILTL